MNLLETLLIIIGVVFLVALLVVIFTLCTFDPALNVTIT